MTQDAELVRCKVCGTEFPHNQWHDCQRAAQDAEYVARLEALLDASFELCRHIGTGWEAHGQSVEATMGQQAVREFRQAVGRAISARKDGSDG